MQDGGRERQQLGPTFWGWEEEIPSKVKSQTHQGGTTDHWLPRFSEQVPRELGSTAPNRALFFTQNQGKVSNIDSQRPRTERPNSISGSGRSENW